ncbi:MAG: signal peptidase I [Ruminococcus sp.]|nr:signal peptidase I [Ruminococcus sp.]
MDKNYRNNKYIIKTGYTGNWVFDWTKSIVAIMFIMLFILTYFFRIVNVDGDSMKNTLINDEKLIVTSFMYTPTDGDIVVISHGQHLDEPIIKRVIATEGETLKIDFDKQKVYVNDKLIDEPYVSSEIVRGDSVIPEIIPEGKIFVMGDNRAISNDSRYNQVGLIDVKDVIGKAQFRILPVDKIGYLY